ncbi:MAG: hypothetical protein WKG07_27820 [Hymenobacter sp.]
MKNFTQFLFLVAVLLLGAGRVQAQGILTTGATPAAAMPWPRRPLFRPTPSTSIPTAGSPLALATRR